MNLLSIYWREILSSLAVIIALYSYTIYIKSIFAWKTEPHIFSWGIWVLTTGIAFFAQVAGWWGWGSAQNGITFLVCFFVTFLALKFGTLWKWDKLDYGSVILSFIAIFLWIKTSNPLYASLFATIADLIWYFPTFRKVWKNPESEPSGYYLLMNTKHILSLFALSVYSPTTIMYSASIVVINFCLIFMQIFRKEKS